MQSSINIVLATAWCYFVWKYISALSIHFSVTTLLFLVLESSIVLAFIFRRSAITSSRRAFDWFSASAAIAAGMMFRPVMENWATFFGDAMLVMGIIIAILGMASLGLRFGIVPANRGIQTGGLYGYVRHPIYSGYLLMYAGYVLSNPSGRNIVVFILCFIFLLLRIFNEERLLTGDPLWEPYAKKTRWRMAPRIY